MGLRWMTSPVWGNMSREVSSEHNEEATWANDYPDPCQLYAYTRGYGMTGCKHPGLDIRLPHGTPVYAIRNGYISWIRNPNQSGAMEVRLRDGSDEYLYTHLHTSAVSEGQQISMGQLIGYSGTPEDSSPHLHFEHRVQDASLPNGWRIIDPNPILRSEDSPSPPPATTFETGDRLRCTSGPLNVRAEPTTSSSVVTSIPTNGEMCCIGGPKSANGYVWWKVNYNGTVGWTVQNYLALKAAGACDTSTSVTNEIVSRIIAIIVNIISNIGSPWTHKVSPSNLNFRPQPSTSSGLIGVLQVNDRVEWLKDSNGQYISQQAGGYTWVKVRSERHNTVGWCVDGLVSI